jgi:minor histocompatibility antigen H13
MFIYTTTQSWMLNNIIAMVTAISTIEKLFLGNFKIGFTLLGLLFFYDIFFVFGTSIMETVAKNISLPIMFVIPGVSDEGKPKFSMIGLGDIVIPGLFVSMAHRLDFIKALPKLS